MNVVINNPHVLPSDLNTLFGNEPIHFSTAKDLQTLMLECKVYSSKSQAMKAGRAGPIPSGWTVFKASKTKTLWIWNPSE